jgi:hypothetical protein
MIIYVNGPLKCRKLAARLESKIIRRRTDPSSFRGSKSSCGCRLGLESAAGETPASCLERTEWNVRDNERT